MDNSSVDVAYGTPRVVIGAVGAICIGAAIGATLLAQADDRPGVLLLWLTAILFALATAYFSLLNPRLAADANGVAIRTIKGTKRVAWPDLQVRVRSTRRLGRDGKTLELEFPGEPGLVSFGMLELGVEPDKVYATLNRLRARN